MYYDFPIIYLPLRAYHQRVVRCTVMVDDRLGFLVRSIGYMGYIVVVDVVVVPRPTYSIFIFYTLSVLFLL